MEPKEIGKRLQDLRGARNQEEVATACGISPAAVGMYERGERVPRDEIKIRLARYFGVSVEDLFYA